MSFAQYRAHPFQSVNLSRWRQSTAGNCLDIHIQEFRQTSDRISPIKIAKLRNPNKAPIIARGMKPDSCQRADNTGAGTLNSL